jgi:hypothetical protein
MTTLRAIDIHELCDRPLIIKDVSYNDTEFSIDVQFGPDDFACYVATLEPEEAAADTDAADHDLEGCSDIPVERGSMH